MSSWAGMSAYECSSIFLDSREFEDGTRIGAFVEIQKKAQIGRNGKISSHTFVCEGMTVEDHDFFGHVVIFINDTYPRAAKADCQ